MSDLAPATPAPTPGIGAVEAVIGTFTKPSDTFGRLVARPTWWLPLVLTLLATAGSFWIVMPKIDMDRTIRESIEKRMEKSGRSASPEVIQRQVEAAKKMTPLYLGIGVVAAIVFFFVIALVLWGGARAMGAEARYAQLLAIWGHSGLPSLVGVLISIPIFLQMPDASLTQDGAQHVLKSNVGAFLDESTPGALRALASSVDIFSIAVLCLLVLGFRKLPGLSKGAATWTPIVLWIVAVAVKVAWKAVMG
ncbi:MAG TPA: YIP1 family protein [Thermoanaerobaculia bacterium]